MTMTHPREKVNANPDSTTHTIHLNYVEHTDTVLLQSCRSCLTGHDFFLHLDINLTNHNNYYGFEFRCLYFYYVILIIVNIFTRLCRKSQLHYT